MIEFVIPGDRQTLVDISMQEAGVADELFNLAILNDKSITAHVVGLNIIKPVEVNSIVSRMLRISKPASDFYTFLNHGIGAMQIESDFKVR